MTTLDNGKRIKIAPSILSADFARLGEQVREAEQAGADYIHVDVMDGHFVPNLTIGPVVVEGIRATTSLPLNVHLMIEEPEKLLGDFIKAGSDHIFVHVEACTHLHKSVHQIKEHGLKAGVALNPSTSLASIEEVLPYLDMVLVLTVNPGFSGQKMIPEVLDKVRRLSLLLMERGLDAEIQVDGGVDANTAPKVVEAGGRILVAGSAVFNKRASVAEAMRNLRAAAEGAGLS
ncbi:MAG: ribulose-phosphate 3-epimerase [Dehalococcoidia bacterium]|nr:ribulose-phosphate 3-epimerase [Dehalococcoidia bacterium]